MVLYPLPEFSSATGIEIPEHSDVLSADYPYYSIFALDLEEYGIVFYIIQSKTEFIYVPEELSSYIGGSNEDLLSITDSVYMMSTNVVNGEWSGSWDNGSEFSTSDKGYFVISDITGGFPSSTPFLTVYANHDIKTATGVDSNGLPVTEGIWFANSAPTETYYRIPAAWLHSIARHARRLGNTTGALTPSQMLEIYTTKASEVSGE